VIDFFRRFNVFEKTRDFLRKIHKVDLDLKVKQVFSDIIALIPKAGAFHGTLTLLSPPSELHDT
jgi:hypothetical protein